MEVEENKLPTLQEFLAGDYRNSYVQEPGFNSLYLRKGAYIFSYNGETKMFSNVLQIANCETERSGEGTFTALVAKLEGMWDGPIFVEQVLSGRFASGLLRMGFVPVNPTHDWGGVPRNFVKCVEKGKKHGYAFTRS